MRVAYFGSDRFSRICLERLLWNSKDWLDASLGALFTNQRIDQGKPVFPQGHLQVFCPPEGKGELLTLAKALELRYELLPPKTLREWEVCLEGGTIRCIDLDPDLHLDV